MLTGRGLPADKSAEKSSGYALLMAIIAITLIAILMLAARAQWSAMVQRDLEQEYFFRARQYVNAIRLYQKKKLNTYPRDLRILEKEKFIRRLYPDPLSASGQWNLVMQPAGGRTKKMLIVPLKLFEKFSSRANFVGVCSTATDTGYTVYRGKKNYSEWAVYLGEKPEEEMPKLEFVESP